MNDIVIFNAVIEREVYNSENFKVYAVAPTTQRDKLKYNKYGNVSICGNIQELSLGMTYTITGKLNKKDGYDVMTIKTPKPKTLEESQRFLYEVITERQADLLLEQYPNIIDMIINDEPVDLSKVKGIKDKTFAKIKAKVEDNFVLMEFIEEFSNYDLTLSMARKLRNKYKTIPRMRQAFNEDPYTALCSISGIGFKKADTLILSNDNNKHMVKSKTRAKACVDYLLGENLNNGNTWIDMTELHKQFYELAYEAEDYLLEVLSDDKVYYYNKKDNRVSFMYIFLKEAFIAYNIKYMLDNPIKWNIDFSKYQEGLSDEQKMALPMICNENMMILSGFSGCGKSRTVGNIIQMLKDNDLNYVLMTPTGKSAVVLSEFTHEDAGTIHRKLKYNPMNEDSNPWFYNEDNKLKTDIVIIDEIGMCDIELFYRVFSAIDTQTTKLLIVGDEAQLSSVQAGNILYDCCNSDLVPITRLTKIFRYGEGGILTAGTKVRLGEMYLKESFDMQSLGTNKDYVFIPTSDEYMIGYVKNVYQKCLANGFKPQDIAVLLPSKKGKVSTETVNIELQKAFNPPTPNKYFVKVGDKCYRVNDPVMQVRNNYRLTTIGEEETTVTNGETGVIIKVNYNDIVVKYPNQTVIYEKSEIASNLDLAYAYTIHKSQGSSIPVVILLSPRANIFMTTRNLLYVGITRAQKMVFHFGLPSTIKSAIKKCEEKKRNTWLLDLLKAIKQNIKK